MAETKEVEKAAPKGKAAVEAPEGLSKDEVQAWQESLPEPAEEIKSTSDVGKRVQGVEARLDNLEKLLNITPPAE
jgi:hypothetical protein